MSDPNKWSLLSKSGWESPSNNEMKRWTDTGHWLFEKVDDLIDPPSLLLLLAPHFVLWSKDTQMRDWIQCSLCAHLQLRSLNLMIFMKDSCEICEILKATITINIFKLTKCVQLFSKTNLLKMTNKILVRWRLRKISTLFKLVTGWHLIRWSFSIKQISEIRTFY